MGTGGASAPRALEEAKKEVAAGYALRGEKINPNSAEPWRQVADKMKEYLEKAPGSIEGKKADLLERQEKLRLSMMSPAEQLKTRQKTAADLETKIGKEKDPERVLDLRGKLLDELEAIKGLKDKGGEGLKTRSLDVGEIFTRMNGQEIGKRDPAERSAKAAEETAAILRRIEQKKGGLAP